MLRKNENDSVREGGKFLLPATLPALAGILNLTEDSFSDGGRFLELNNALSQGEKLLREGAFLLDVGAESTRPGAEEIPLETEQERLLRFLTPFREREPRAVISIDTRKSLVAEACLQAGADIINDVSGLRFDPRMKEVVAAYDCHVVIMHSRGTPENMQEKANLDYGSDFLETFLQESEEMIQNALSSGIARERILFDPGLGFAKSVEQNWQLVKACRLLRERLALPLFYGFSRKSFLDLPTGRKNPPVERESVNLAVLGFLASEGVEFCRVHDVKSARDYLSAERFLKVPEKSC